MPVFVDKVDIIKRRYKPIHGASKPFVPYLFPESEAIGLYFLYQDSAEPVRMWDLRAQKCLQKELTILRKASCWLCWQTICMFTYPSFPSAINETMHQTKCYYQLCQSFRIKVIDTDEHLNYSDVTPSEQPCIVLSAALMQAPPSRGHISKNWLTSSIWHHTKTQQAVRHRSLAQA